MLLEDAKVLSRERLKGDYFFLRLRAPGIAAGAAPGQFVHLRVPALEATALRRPFSICDADVKTGSLDILYKEVGRGTRAMDALREGDSVNLMGPLGNTFPMPRADETPVFVAGGFGVAPLLFLAKRFKAIQEAQGGVRKPMSLLVGGRSAEDILLADEFAQIGVATSICTDDGSLGEKGFVTVALDKRLDEKGLVLYCCGPDALLRAVDERAQARGLSAWLSLDRRMGCAVGACLGCVVKMKRERMLRVCKDGPVFGSGTVEW